MKTLDKQERKEIQAVCLTLDLIMRDSVIKELIFKRTEDNKKSELVIKTFTGGEYKTKIKNK